MFDMCSFLFCRAVDEKGDRMDHVLQFFQQVDNLVGRPVVGALSRNRIYLTLRLGLLQIRYLPKAFRLIFTEDEGLGIFLASEPLRQHSSGYCRDGNIGGGVAAAIQTGGPGVPFDVGLAAFLNGDQHAEGLFSHSLSNQG